jgi:hypothetical protein
MANILDARLKKDDEDKAKTPPENILKEEARFKMRTFALGLRAQGKKLALDKYIEEELIAKQLPALQSFENGLMDHAQHVESVRTRMQAFEQGNKQFLVIDEGKIDGTSQTFTLLDTRDDKKKTVKVEVAYESPPVKDMPSVIKSIKVNDVDVTGILKNKNMPSGKLYQFLHLQEILAAPDMTIASLGAPTLRELGAAERSTTTLAFSDAKDGTAPAAPKLWELPINPDALGSDKDRKI